MTTSRKRKISSHQEEPLTRDNLIIGHQYLVAKISNWILKKVPAHVQHEELYAAGLEGLIQAADNFNPSLSVKFSTYANRRIRGAIYDYLREIDHLSRSSRKFQRQVAEAKETLAQQLRRKPSEDEVSVQMGLSLKEYRKRCRESGVSIVSLSAPVGAKDASDLSSWLAVTEDFQYPSPAQLALQEEQRSIILALIDSLGDPYTTVIHLSYVDGRTLANIGEEILHVTESRVCQIRTEALKRIRRELRRIQAEENSLLCA